MTEYNEEELFAFADEAMAARRIEQDEDLEDTDDTSTLFSNGSHLRVRPSRQGRPLLLPIGDGDYHLCFGKSCRHVEMDRDRELVCTISGLVVGRDCKLGEDSSWTGRSTASANPDDAAGTPIGGWARRRDMFAASSRAYEMARQMDVATNATDLGSSELDAPTFASRPVGRSSSKRGALCVDEVGEDDLHIASEAAKRQRCALKRETPSRGARAKLELEAAAVISRLMSAPGEVDSPAPAPEPAPAAPPAPLVDARLQNVEFVRRLALRRYVKQCEQGDAILSLDGVHNVCVAANEFVRKQRRGAEEAAQSQSQSRAKAQAKAQTRKRQRTSKVSNSGQVHALLGKLVVSLWQAACLTPHMTQSRRGSDSFRPFAAGVLYQLKRGLYLNNGVCVIPRIDELAEQLPALRCPNASTTAKQLQSSSHRGICSLHKSISSMSELDAEAYKRVNAAFETSAAQCSLLRALVDQHDQC
jgi:hypothetical protein